MAKSIVKAKAFRDTFEFGSKEVMHWFPGHMHKGMQQMQRKLIDVDCVIEVHDARGPDSKLKLKENRMKYIVKLSQNGRNPMFHDAIKLRPHLLVLNKMDLADLKSGKLIADRLKKTGASQVLYTNCRQEQNSTVKKKIMPAVLELIHNNPRYHRADAEDYNLLIIGVPNVGKSSLINAMRRIHLKKGHATTVGSVAGVTRSVLEKIKVSEQPRVYLLDTPGIVSHNIENVEVGMKLALCATLQDHLVGEDTITDYMLYRLNRNRMFRYVKHFGLEEPTDDVWVLLNHISKNKNLIQKKRSVSGGYVYEPNFLQAAKIALTAFREGRLGKVMLDDDFLPKKELSTNSS